MEDATIERYNHNYSKRLKINIKPALVAFAYGDIANIDNKKDSAYSISVLSKFPYVVTTNPGKLSPEQTMVADAIKKRTKLFGYVNFGPNLAVKNLQSEIDNIAKAGWYGVFIDQYGYDWGITRDLQNEINDYIHAKGLCSFVNSWDIEAALGNKVDPVYNPKGTAPHLGVGDWALLESFCVSILQYYCDESQFQKYIKAMNYQKQLGIHFVALSYKLKNKNWKQSLEDIRISHTLTRCLGFKGWWMASGEISNNLRYGRDPSFAIGNTVTQYLTQIKRGEYLAKTDKIMIKFTSGRADKAPRMIVLPLDAQITVDLALNKPVWASSVEVSYFNPELAVDGDLSTRWSSVYSDPQWIFVDLGAYYWIHTVRLDWERASASRYQIQVSNDGMSWTAVYVYDDGKALSNNTVIEDLKDRTELINLEDVPGRYVRVYCEKRTSPWGYSLYNFEVEGRFL